MTFLVIDKQRFAYFSRLAPKKLQRGPVPDGSRVEFLDRTGCVPTLLQLGEVHTVTISLVRDGRTLPVRATAELKIFAPQREQLYSLMMHVVEFDGLGQAMLLIPGQHGIRIALPRYMPFDHIVDLRPSCSATQVPQKLATPMVALPTPPKKRVPHALRSAAYLQYWV